MPYKDKEKGRTYLKTYHKKHYRKKGYHANSGSFKTGHLMSSETKYKIGKAVKGRIVSEETKKKMSLARIGIKLSDDAKVKLKLINLGRKQSPETIQKKRASMTGLKRLNWPYKGEKHWSYKKDRTLLAKKQMRNDGAYCEWRRQVWLRDGFLCKIADKDCNGKIEAHHILNWTSYPDLRYNINNGITLCHFHHPRKRAVEAKLAPVFQGLIAF